MGIEDLQCNRHSPLFSVYYRTHYGWGSRKRFLIKALRWLQNAILKLAIANTVFHKRSILQIFDVEFKESVV